MEEFNYQWEMTRTPEMGRWVVVDYLVVPKIGRSFSIAKAFETHNETLQTTATNEDLSIPCRWLYCDNLQFSYREDLESILSIGDTIVIATQESGYIAIKLRDEEIIDVVLAMYDNKEFSEYSIIKN